MRTSVLLVCGSLLASTATAADPTPRRAFPLVVRGAEVGSPTLELDASRLAAIRVARAVRFDDVVVPALGTLDLELTQVHLEIAPFAVRVDGALAASPALESFSAWTGRIAGRPGSEVFLAFSRFGSRGFVADGSRRVQLDALPDSAGDWGHARSVWRPESGEPLPSQKVGLPYCAGAIPRPSIGASTAVPRSPSPGAPQKSTGVTPIYECHVAIETDTQYFSLFGSLPAAQTYLFQILAAVSSRYREQVGVILTYPYIGFHTASDNWVAQEQGGGSLGLLFEFQAAWQFDQGPVHADLYHFVSGADLGGGVAYLPAVCDQQYGFGVSGNIGGNTPFPIAVGPLNWDFMVVTHELGHNLGAPHTHDYCPTPADECAPGGYFGACQTQQVCTPVGTVMSYCHLCSGGLSNITTYLHPWSVADCRALVTSSCLQFFEGIAYYANLGYALAGSNGTPTLGVSYDAPTDTLAFAVAQAPQSRPAVLFLAATTAYLPLYGGTLVPAVEILVPFSTNPTGAFTLAAALPPGSVSIPGGATFYAQAWISDPVSFVAATNGSEFELVLP